MDSKIYNQHLEVQIGQDRRETAQMVEDHVVHQTITNDHQAQASTLVEITITMPMLIGRVQIS